MEALCSASDSSASFSGTDVLPAIRVKISVCESSGRVYSIPMAAAAANAAVTPGITLHGIDFLSSFAICSNMAP